MGILQIPYIPERLLIGNRHKLRQQHMMLWRKLKSQWSLSQPLHGDPGVHPKALLQRYAYTQIHSVVPAAYHQLIPDSSCQLALAANAVVKPLALYHYHANGFLTGSNEILLFQ